MHTRITARWGPLTRKYQIRWGTERRYYCCGTLEILDCFWELPVGVGIASWELEPDTNRLDPEAVTLIRFGGDVFGHPIYGVREWQVSSYRLRASSLPDWTPQVLEPTHPYLLYYTEGIGPMMTQDGQRRRAVV